MRSRPQKRRARGEMLRSARRKGPNKSIAVEGVTRRDRRGYDADARGAFVDARLRRPFARVEKARRAPSAGVRFGPEALSEEGLLVKSSAG